jgi:uncharacterized protein YndB with AHSA1/START domain
MMLRVKAGTTIARPRREVFEAIVNPARMSCYFTSAGSGRMEAGKTITWTFADVGAELAVRVGRVEQDRHIAFTWPASGVETSVAIELTAADDGATWVAVEEGEWADDPEGIARFGEQGQGWSDMLACLKAYLLFGVNPRTGKLVEAC